MPREYSDTSISVSQPARVVAVPPMNTIPSFWQNATTNTILCNLVAPAGSIIDVWVDFVLSDGNTGYSASPATLVGATAGIMYYTCLDSQTNASGIYKPVSLTVL